MSDSSTKLPIDRVVGVVGLGYVGLPLLLAYARAGYTAVGLDIDPSKPEALQAGKTYIKHIPDSQIVEAQSAGRLDATTDFSRARDCDALILCVPTPLDEHFEPDLSYVVSTIESLVPHMRAGQTISLESTTYPGTTDEELVTRVEAAGFQVGKDIHVVYSPEREDPGNPDFAATNIPKVVGGVTPACLEAGIALYTSVFDQVVPVSSCKVAELTKLLENIYRAVNIGLVNELKIAADRMGIDIWEVIRAASTKPFGFKPFFPGPGLGGHCIPIDPFYLTWKAREYGVHTRFIELAGEINRSMPDYVIHRTMEALNSRGKAVKGSRILLLGLAYKADVDDMRESPTFALLDGFKRLGAEVTYHDPHVPVVGPTREHMEWAGMKSLDWTEENLRSQDCIVISTHHQAFNLLQLATTADLIVDTRNAMAGIDTPGGQVVKA
ncbi:UDP-N-acetyl-D-glucosamine dehydrogenase [Haloferula luteola]|uniref:UDP-N-acetyl-D-glucosamine dehydrogenase n=1 Tax=Haloferula luteola TaxID=595692 RepID=A0A840UYD6_9BACT|nr:nucleotide sugar dehydrogenase [Haloferula luteola]MBB5350792.1 UDP-N-acetyl-D-glucosamine dehydrogenase [Haloferula luteola]